MVLCDFNDKVEGDDDDDDDEVVDEQGRRNGTEGQRICVYDPCSSARVWGLVNAKKAQGIQGSNKAWFSSVHLQGSIIRVRI